MLRKQWKYSAKVASATGHFQQFFLYRLSYHNLGTFSCVIYTLLEWHCGHVPHLLLPPLFPVCHFLQFSHETSTLLFSGTRTGTSRPHPCCCHFWTSLPQIFPHEFATQPSPSFLECTVSPTLCVPLFRTLLFSLTLGAARHPRPSRVLVSPLAALPSCTQPVLVRAPPSLLLHNGLSYLSFLNRSSLRHRLDWLYLRDAALLFSQYMPSSCFRPSVVLLSLPSFRDFCTMHMHSLHHNLRGPALQTPNLTSSSTAQCGTANWMSSTSLVVRVDNLYLELSKGSIWRAEVG